MWVILNKTRVCFTAESARGKTGCSTVAGTLLNKLRTECSTGGRFSSLFQFPGTIIPAQGCRPFSTKNYPLDSFPGIPPPGPLRPHRLVQSRGCPAMVVPTKTLYFKGTPVIHGTTGRKNLLRAKYVCLRVCGSIHIQILILYSICCPIVPGKPEALVAESFRAWDNLQDRRRDRAKSFQPVPYIDPLPPVNGERRPVGCFPLARHPDYKDKYSIAASRKIQRFRRNPSERESPFFRSWCILCFCRKNMIY